MASPSTTDRVFILIFLLSELRDRKKINGRDEREGEDEDQGPLRGLGEGGVFFLNILPQLASERHG